MCLLPINNVVAQGEVTEQGLDMGQVTEEEQAQTQTCECSAAKLILASQAHSKSKPVHLETINPF